MSAQGEEASVGAAGIHQHDAFLEWWNQQELARLLVYG